MYLSRTVARSLNRCFGDAGKPQFWDILMICMATRIGCTLQCYTKVQFLLIATFECTMTLQYTRDEQGPPQVVWKILLTNEPAIEDHTFIAQKQY
jgi:hypothetical protein